MDMRDQQTAITLASDFATVPWAAEQIGISDRQVRRLIGAGTLSGQRARIGSKETGRRHVMLRVEEVLEYARARRIVEGSAR